jgi:hypothetical protein
MQASSEVTVHPIGGGMPRMGKDVAVEGLLGAGGGALAAALLPGPVAPRLWTLPPVKVTVPVVPVLGSVDATVTGVVEGGVVVATADGPAPEFEVTPEAVALACAKPKVMEVVAV